VDIAQAINYKPPAVKVLTARPWGANIRLGVGGV